MKARAKAKEVGNEPEEAIAYSESFEILEGASNFEQDFRSIDKGEQERQKQQLLEQQSGKNKITARTVTKNIPNYTNPDIQKTSGTERVSVFGIESWKKIIGDRTIANLQDMAIKIKSTRDRQNVQINGIDSVSVGEER